MTTTASYSSWSRCCPPSPDHPDVKGRGRQIYPESSRPGTARWSCHGDILPSPSGHCCNRNQNPTEGDCRLDVACTSDCTSKVTRRRSMFADVMARHRFCLRHRYALGLVSARGSQSLPVFCFCSARQTAIHVSITACVCQRGFITRILPVLLLSTFFYRSSPLHHHSIICGFISPHEACLYRHFSHTAF